MVLWLFHSKSQVDFVAQQTRVGLVDLDSVGPEFRGQEILELEKSASIQVFK